MREDLKRIAGDIAGSVHCASDYRCAAGGVEGLCEAYEFPFRQFLKCSGGPSECPFRMPFNHDGICQCPLRLYLVEKLAEHSCVEP
jgi:hypothetical protein